MTIGHSCLKALVSRPPAARWRHVGFDPGLIDEDQPCSVDLALMRLPALPLAGDIRLILLGGPICFFETARVRFDAPRGQLGRQLAQ
jgi:hypothetical protein